MKKNTNIWLNGIMGVIVGDALGCPVQFESRDRVACHPVTGMRGYGTFNLPEGSWTDDSSLTLALLESIRRVKGIDLDDIMNNFMKWLYGGSFTPYGKSYDIGNGTMEAIDRYKRTGNAKSCGGRSDWNNGNGSLMRILPACIYCSEMLRSGDLSEGGDLSGHGDLSGQGDFSELDAVQTIHAVGGLTHAHVRSNIACGLYFFMVHQILTGEGPLRERLQAGLINGFAFYESWLDNKDNLRYYHRLRNLDVFAAVPAKRIKSSGYVVDTLEAAVWSLITTESFDQALLKAVNLGDDTDTVGAVTGGLAGLYYGYGRIPADWLSAIKRRDWIEGLCDLT